MKIQSAAFNSPYQGLKSRNNMPKSNIAFGDRFNKQQKNKGSVDLSPLLALVGVGLIALGLSQLGNQNEENQTESVLGTCENARYTTTPDSVKMLKSLGYSAQEKFTFGLEGKPYQFNPDNGQITSEAGDVVDLSTICKGK